MNISNPKFEEFSLQLSLREVSGINPWNTDPVVRLPDPKPAKIIVPEFHENLDYDSDEAMQSCPDEEMCPEEEYYYDVEISANESAALSGVDPMEIELEDIRMKAVQSHFSKSSWNPSALIDRLFCCSSSRPNTVDLGFEKIGVI